MLRWFIDKDGNKVDVKEFIEKRLLCNEYPLSYLKLCAKEREWSGTPSTTQLINGNRQSYLKILTDYAINPADCSYRVHGTLAHNKIEVNTSKEDLAELNITYEEISGMFDLLENNDGVYSLIDFKTWGSYKVALALGLEKKERPLFHNGNPVLYTKSGKWGKAGDQKIESYYEPNEKLIDMDDVILQLNRYRYVLEQSQKIKIDKLKVFAIVRDGGTFVAKNRGIDKNTYYIDVPIIDDKEVQEYFNDKKDKLVTSVENFKISIKPDMEYQEKFDLLARFCPPMCNNKESWNGRKCQGFCEVSKMCNTILEYNG